MSQSPLFDLFDPYGIQSLNAEAGLSDDPFSVVPVKRKPRVEDLLPEEEKASMLQWLANKGSSGLSGVGWLLDTPGSMVRGLLSDGPMKGLSALWETSEDRVTGRELLRQYGLAGDKDTWQNFGSSLGAEVLLDPLTYLSAGIAPLLGGVAKNTAGKLATRSGILAQDLSLAAKELSKKTGRNIGKSQLMRESPETLLGLMPEAVAKDARSRFIELAGDNADDLLRSSMSASNRVSIPFLYENAFDLYGKAAGDKIAQAADYIGDYARAAPAIGPLVRSAEAMFSPSLMGFTDDRGRMFGQRITQGGKYADEEASRKVAGAFVNAARGVGEDTFRSPAFADAVRDVAEGYAERVPDELAPLFADGMPGASLVGSIRRWQAAELKAARARGLKVSKAKLPNDLQYMFRQAVKVDNPRLPTGYAKPADIAYDRQADLLGLGVGKQARRDYTSAFPTWVLNDMARDAGLRDTLRNLADDGVDELGRGPRQIVDDWLQTNAKQYTDRLGGAGPYDYLRSKMLGPDDASSMLEADRRISNNYSALIQKIRSMPDQFAEQQLPMFGNSLNDTMRYMQSRARGNASADVALKTIGENLVDTAASAVPGGVNISVEQALKELGFNTKIGRKQVYSPGHMALAREMGVSPTMLANNSIPRELVDQMLTKVSAARTPREARGLLKSIDNFTQRFKSLALLYPSRYTRDMYSGQVASATKGVGSIANSIAGARIGRGSYDMIPGKVRHLPDYQRLNTPKRLNWLRSSAPQYKAMSDEQLLDELMIRKFLADSGGQGLTSASVVDDIGRSASNLTMQEAAPGLSGPYMGGVRQKMNPMSLDFWNPFALRTRQGNPNWLLDIGDRAASASDNFNRIGAYLTAVQRGDSPRAAKALADLTQVNYRPDAFTSFERDVVKRAIPFYSYTKGITPLVKDELINNPAGLMGQSIRAVNRASEPSENRFTPEYLRQSAAIPLDNIPGLGVTTPGVTRFLTNIDLPHESLLNLFTPGVSNTLFGTVGDSIQKTGQNLLGQTNPLLKGPLEYFLNRQFYSGRQLSDLYSMLEHDLSPFGLGPLGRAAEQIGVNLPGGSRLLGLIRQTRDQRITPAERAAKIAFNTLTGMKVQDVDQEKTVRLAARDTLNKLLDQAQGMSSYENLFIKPEDLMKLSPQEQKQYLLYRTLQSQAARESRARKKEQELMDPMEILGVI